MDINIKTLPDEMTGRLVVFYCNFKLSPEPGDNGVGEPILYGDVGIIIDVTLSRKKCLNKYSEYTVWYKVQSSENRIGWYDSESIEWKAQELD